MAFHPFGFFRKRQKSFLAALTILSMFIFILTGFSGSIVDRVGYWFGRRGGDTTEVTKLYGKTVTVGDMDALLLNRRMANAFMSQAIAAALPSLTDAERNEVTGRVSGFFRESMFDPGRLRASLTAYRRELLKDNKTNAARYVQHMMRELETASWAQAHPGQLYFGGGTGMDDLLDFLVWRKQAEKLDVNLTDEDIRKAVNAEADGDVLTGEPNKDAEKISLYLGRQFRTPDPKTLYNALRDEFRVRLAKEILLGSAGSARAASGDGLAGAEVPGEGTPQEFWEYYKDNLTSLKVAFLKLPVKQFTGEVKAQPTEQELKDLFQRGKNDEPNPERPVFGFKVPRKVKVEYVAADPDAAHYRAVAEKALPLLNAGAPLSMLAFPASGGGVAGGVAGIAAPLALPFGEMTVGALWPAPVLFEYEAYSKGVKSWWDASNVTPQGTNPWATGLDRPDTAAAAVGQLLGSGLTGAPSWSSACAALGAKEARLAEQKVRQASMVLAGSGPFPLSVAAQEAALSNVPVPPLAAVRDDVAARLSNRIGPQMATAAIAAFIDGLQAKHSNPQEAAEYVKTSANIEHGITGHGVMKDAKDEQAIADDPDLATLREAQKGDAPFPPSAQRRFAEAFFTTFGPDGRPVQTQLYQPQPITAMRGNARYYWWLTESEKPKPRNYTEAKADVEEAWKLIQARKEARQAADRMVEALKKRGEGISADLFLKDEAEKLKAANPKAGDETFDLIGISRLVAPTTPFVSMTRYEPYKFPETNVTYPRPDTVDQLMDKLKQPGDAAVFTDRPERNYYVAVLQERKVPSEKDFFNVYQRAPKTFLSDTLWARFQAEREQKYRADVTRHLREDSQAPLDDQGNYRIDPEVRKRIRGGPGEE